MFLFDITCMVKSLIIKIQIIHFPFFLLNPLKRLKKIKPIPVWSRQILYLPSQTGILIWPRQIRNLPRPNKNSILA